jgi:hypothetical protein
MPKTIVAIIVYNRFDNLKLWLACWDNCDQTDAELVVIHNYDDPFLLGKWVDLCVKHNVEYIYRENVGLDIGAFRDVCQGKADIQYDNLIWITDDTIPMSKDFVKQFIEPLGTNYMAGHVGEVGLTCMEIANYRAPLHVRTTGFCITKEVADKLTFNDIKTKEDCYFFEHRGGDKTLMRQVELMGKKCVQIAPLETSPLWDTHNRAHLKRMAEHQKVFASEPKVIIICPVYGDVYPQIISSLICQTYKNWELHLVHDGKATEGFKAFKDLYTDKRIFLYEEPEHSGNYGHSIRAKYLRALSYRSEYVIISNIDNYYMPVFLEKAIESMQANPRAVATYCSQIVHNYTGFKVMNCRLARGYIDAGNVMLKFEEAASVGWNSTDHSADWFFFEDIAKKYGVNSFVRFEGCLFTHN